MVHFVLTTVLVRETVETEVAALWATIGLTVGCLLATGEDCTGALWLSAQVDGRGRAEWQQTDIDQQCECDAGVLGLHLVCDLSGLWNECLVSQQKRNVVFNVIEVVAVAVHTKHPMGIEDENPGCFR